MPRKRIGRPDEKIEFSELRGPAQAVFRRQQQDPKRAFGTKEVEVTVITIFEETAMSEQKQKLGRREFLKKAAVTGGAAGVAAVALSQGSAEAAVVSGGPKSSGYRETEHVKTYYDLARF